MNPVTYDLMIAILIAVLTAIFVGALFWLPRAPSFPRRRYIR